MKSTFHFTKCLFACVLLLCSAATAQNIRNDTIGLNTEVVFAISFPDKPGARIPDGDGSYIVDKNGEKALTVKAAKKNTLPQEMIITEGKRTHQFILVYKEEITELKKAWSNKKALDKYVGEKSRLANERLTAADKLCEQEQYDQARRIYTAALNDFEENARAAVEARMTECQKKEEKKKEQTFNEAMYKGNAHAARKNYKEADAEYAKAITIKLGDADAESKRRINKKDWYDASITKANAAFTAKDYATAETAFEEAQNADASQLAKSPYLPNMRIATEMASGKRFALLKDRGDDAFELHSWEEAKIAYEAALKEKKTDSRCKERLAFVTDKLTEAAEKKKDETAYFNLLAEAKKLAGAKQYDAAIAKYKQAAEIFKLRQFSKDKIEKMKQLKNGTAKQ